MPVPNGKVRQPDDRQHARPSGGRSVEAVRRGGEKVPHALN
eukprot:CAMPEP_0115829660 /NCGR_PEP_ID=MMETSP0287-20121206/1214_1 /TAXON_ID=412157 /ORGANISM="Chrysochromulina rotalis, Strain UIO044" /LENGTH=40 /DNA_ID= /DNA_START= /DNA_END= /DNA_ORIENTATION=